MRLQADAVHYLGGLSSANLTIDWRARRQIIVRDAALSNNSRITFETQFGEAFARKRRCSNEQLVGFPLPFSLLAAQQKRRSRCFQFPFQRDLPAALELRALRLQRASPVKWCGLPSLTLIHMIGLLTPK